VWVKERIQLSKITEELTAKGYQSAPRGIKEMREMAKSQTKAMLQVLVDIAHDGDERGEVRIKAADLLLSRAWGGVDTYKEPHGDDNSKPEQLSTDSLQKMLAELKTTVSEEEIEAYKVEREAEIADATLELEFRVSEASKVEDAA
jgi:hypothetical protein